MKNPEDTKIYAFVLIAVILTLAGVSYAKLACELTLDYTRPDHAPAASDVTIRSLNFRPINEQDPYNTIEAMQAFHATRLEWVYLRFNQHEKQLIDTVNRMGRIFGGAGAGASGVKVGMDPGREFIENNIEDLNGAPIFAEHSRHWVVPIYPGCMNNPHYIKAHLDYYKKYVDWGCQTLQRDEPASQYSYARNRQGCFCDYCMAAFRKYIKKNNLPGKLKKHGINDIEGFNYRNWLSQNGYAGDDGRAKPNPLADDFTQFQLETNTGFYRNLRTALHIYSEGYMPMSCNNTSFQRWEEPFYSVFDFAISELMMSSAKPGHMYDRARHAAKLNKVQVFGSPKTLGREYDEQYLTKLKRKVIATAYAVGGLSRVPWDIFQQTKDGKGRYFGKPQHYADLYAFVRANDRYLAGYRDSGAFGNGIDINVWGSEKPLEIIAPQQDVYAFIRAIPADSSAPVVVHLVDWSDDKSGFDLALKNDCFFRSSRLNVKLLTPAEYSKQAHEAAEAVSMEMLEPGEFMSAKQAKAFASLSDENLLKTRTTGGLTSISIPPLKPWGILVITGD